MSESVNTSESFFDSTEASATNSTASTANVPAPTETPSAASTSVDASVFLSSVPEEFRNEACLKDFKDVNSLVKSYVHQQKFIGKSVQVPGEDATPEEKASFYNKLGRPETIEGYELNKLAESNENLSSLKDLVSTKLNDFSKVAHELGLSKDAAKRLAELNLKEFETELARVKESKQVEFKAAETKLKELWGKDFETKLGQSKEVKDLLLKSHPEEMTKLLESDAVRNPIVISMMADLRKLYNESPAQASVDSNINGVVDPQAKIDALKKDPKHPYWNHKDPGHNEAVAEVNKLYMDTIQKG